jgi:hypothetical protein
VTAAIPSKYTDIELRRVGIETLLHKLGHADTLGFLSQISAGQGDYLEWREQMFAGAAVEEMFERAKSISTEAKR